MKVTDLKQAAELAGERELLLAWQNDVKHARDDASAQITVVVKQVGAARCHSVAWDTSRRLAREAVQARLDTVEERLKALGAAL